MDKKIRQVTDTIHETIYLSRLESEMISTPYFYRLHDVYQTSTVYMTFPSNRTKRYEHSLGTMEIASEMLFSSVSNAGETTREKLFEELHHHFESIVKLVIKPAEHHGVQYFDKKIEGVFDSLANRKGTVVRTVWDAIENEEIASAVAKEYFSDSALDQYQFYPMKTAKGKGAGGAINYFLYRCLLQAVRIVALFHDVGHPPYSHIIEEVLEKLYTEYAEEKGMWDEKKANDLKECLEPFATKDPGKAYACHTLYGQSSLTDSIAIQ